LKVKYTKQFEKEIKVFDLNTREELFNLIEKWMSGERLNRSQFKTFKLSNYKVQEFKAKDIRGGWRIISFLIEKDLLILLYGFQKKSQKLLGRNKKVILKRIKEVISEKS